MVDHFAINIIFLRGVIFFLYVLEGTNQVSRVNRGRIICADHHKQFMDLIAGLFHAVLTLVHAACGQRELDHHPDELSRTHIAGVS